MTHFNSIQSPHIALQFDLNNVIYSYLWPEHINPASTVHSSFHPSPFCLLPSSHSSKTSLFPSPHTPTQTDDPSVLVVPIGHVVHFDEPASNLTRVKGNLLLKVPASQVMQPW